MSRLSDYVNGLNGGDFESRWGALGRRDRESNIARRAARRAYVPPEDEVVEEEPKPVPEEEPKEEDSGSDGRGLEPEDHQRGG